jgi:hypothetical protein
MTCSCIDKLTKERGSRRACLGLLNKLDDMLATVERLNLLVVDPSDADEFSTKAQIQIDLFTLIESKKEDVEAYVTLRADDESSVGSCMQSIKGVPLATRPSAPDKNEVTQSEKLLAEARKRAAEAQQEAAQLRERLEEVNKKADLANKEASKLSDAAMRRGSAPTIISNPFHGWGDGAIDDWHRRSTHEPTKEDGEEEAPDDWIDRYCNGLEEANWSYSSKSAARGDLPIYSGRATDWFWWSDLLRSMVHDQRIAPGEKLAVLKSRLRGDQFEIVQGLGGGESAYKAALF